MKRLIVAIILISTLLPCGVVAQLFEAGPNRYICSGTGVDLGVAGQMIPESWCIHWSPEESLDDPMSARPHASPEATTVYTVEVLTDDWQSLQTDQVTVYVEFGGIKFTPPFLKQGSDETVQAVVTVNPNNDPVTWSIDGEAMGCTIDPMTGVITPGDQYGTITVKAAKTENPDCYAIKKIDINEGTKDVTATDFMHAGRIAKEGRDTLYLVGESAAIINAIPNASGFQSGSPKWYDDGNSSTLVLPEGQSEYLDDNPIGVDRRFVAGSSPDFKPNVTVIRLGSDELVIDLGPLFTKLTDYLKDINDRLKASIAKKFPNVPNLSVEVNILAFKYKKSKSEKYNDPGWDFKYVVEGGGSLKLSGKLYHPQFTAMINLEEFIGLTLGSELYLEPYFEGSFTGSVTKDPSKSDPGWTLLGNPIKLSTTGGIRGVFNVYATGINYKVTGGFSAQTEITLDALFYLTTGELKVKFTLAPLQGNTKLVVERIVDPKKKYSFFDYTVDLIDKIVSPEFQVFDFGEQQ